MLRTWRFSVLAFSLIWLCCGCSSGESKSVTIGADWPTAPPEEQGFDSAALAEVIAQIDVQGLPIDSVQVARNGVLILDAYFYPYLGGQKHDIASVTKSVTSTLIGIAVDRGSMTLDQGMLASFPDLAPGAEWAYCSPGSHLMSAMIANASGTSTLEFAKENLFGPLGIIDVTWPTDPQGANRGG